VSAAAHVLAGLAGAAVVAWTIISAVATVVVPRGVGVSLTRWVFAATMIPFRLRARHAKDATRRDAVLAAYAPAGLLALPVAWLVLVAGGFMLMDWALGAPTIREAFAESGSSLFTLGIVVPKSMPQTALAFTEAGLGLGLVALLITFLPSIYASYSRRELMVTALETQAGSPPSAGRIIERLARMPPQCTITWDPQGYAQVRW